ncbi:MAG: hypothetical protein WCX23_02085 [Candidatus Paceibacterota bacterium]
MSTQFKVFLGLLAIMTLIIAMLVIAAKRDSVEIKAMQSSMTEALNVEQAEKKYNHDESQKLDRMIKKNEEESQKRQEEAEKNVSPAGSVTPKIILVNYAVCNVNPELEDCK